MSATRSCPLTTRRRIAIAAVLGAFAVTGCTRVMLGAANLIENGAAPRREFAYGDGPRQRYDVYRPVDAKRRPLAGPLPVVIFVHGGSWQSGDKARYGFVGQALALEGFVAVLPNYGLMPARRFPDFVDDVAAAVAQVRAHAGEWGGDTGRIFLMGHSAGAQIGALVAYDGRYLAKQGLTPAVLAGFIGLSGPYDFALDTPLLQATFGGPAEREHDSQPVAFVTRDAPPTLLAMGREDTTVDPRNTISLAARLHAAGAPVEEVWVDGEHGATVGAFARIHRGDNEVVRRVRAFVLAR
jgi:acetyl esterase/lipase